MTDAPRPPAAPADEDSGDRRRSSGRARSGATLGVAIGGSYSRLGQMARQAEARGLDAVWVAETSHDSLVQATYVGTVTERIQVGTDITLAFPRSPTVTAMAAWDLAELTGDRFVVGLGSQVRRIVEERFAADFDHPARRMAEYVQAMRAVWAMERGEAAAFDGELYRVLRPGLAGLGAAGERAVPRVYVAAVGPLMTKVAATHADGILGHPFTSDRYLADAVLPRLADALAAADRDRAEVTVAQGLIVCISDDRDEAVREAKAQIGFYGTTPNYKPVFGSYGDEALTGELRRAWVAAKRDPAGLAAAVPDAAVERYAVAGTPAEVRDRLSSFDGLADHLVLSGPWYGVSPGRAAENFAAILDTWAA